MGALALEDIDRQVGANLGTLRQQRRIEIGDLVDATGISEERLRKYESGVLSIPASNLLSLAQMMGVRVERLFEGLPLPDNQSAAMAREAQQLGRCFNRIADLRRRQAFLDLIKQVGESPHFT